MDYLAKVIDEKSFKESLLKGTFSWKKLQENLGRAYAEGRMREAIPETMFGQLTRYGIQLIANDWYQRVPVDYPKFCQEYASKSRQEWHAPLYRGELPQKVGPSGNFVEGKLKGADIMLINEKWGKIFSFERELFDDDQTGQIQQRAAQIGEDLRIIEDINAIGKLVATGLTYGVVTVDPSPYSTVDVLGNVVNAVYSTAVGNLATSTGGLSQPLLETAEIALVTMLDPLGNNMLVIPDTLIFSPADNFNAPKILKSAYQPSIPGFPAVTLAQGVPGSTGWTETYNPLYGRYQMIMSRYLPTTGLDSTNGAWYLGQKNRGLVFQRRDAIEVVQEAPNSGQSFEKDAYRFRGRDRFVVDWVECRFWYQGN